MPYADDFDYFCPACHASYPATALVWRCRCGSHLELPLGPGLTTDQIDHGEPSLWRYRAALPLATWPPAAYFGEGLTPLVKRRWGGCTVHFKLDYLFPSGSFKDRGSALLVNRLYELGVRALHEDSSGNGGASIATYCAAAGIACTIYTPAHSSPAKLVQIRAHGARLVRVPGTRQDTAEAAMAAADASFYAGHNWQPLFIEGVKTLAYELWEQLGDAPDVIIAPIGYGSTILGLYRGFSELRVAGAVTRLPRLIACQAASCAAFVRAFEAGDAAAGVLRPEEVRPTVAEGVASLRPLRVREVLKALAETQGKALAASEDEILTALRELAALGLY
ncbi:MAG TPA: pyridoxal-phosphate dependent enzyme, partial [Bacillota bacterium]